MGHQWGIRRIQGLSGHLFRQAARMASSNEKTHQTVPPSPSTALANETSRARSIATRLTDAELREVEAAAAIAGKKVAEWLREAALTQHCSPSSRPPALHKRVWADDRP
jgi:hypothetical protein